MEQISNFFKPLGERFSSPLVYSFVLAWLLINWRIPIGIILYNSKTTMTGGYDSFFDFILSNLKPGNGLTKPLIAAIVFTVTYPVLKNCIQAYNVWTKTWGNKWNLKLAKEGKISVEQYLKLTEAYKKRSELLQKVLDDESKIVIELTEQQRKTLQLSDEKNIIFRAP